MVDIHPNIVGRLIGKAGVRIQEMQQRTNALVSSGSGSDSEMSVVGDESGRPCGRRNTTPDGMPTRG